VASTTTRHDALRGDVGHDHDDHDDREPEPGCGCQTSSGMKRGANEGRDDGGRPVLQLDRTRFGNTPTWTKVLSESPVAGTMVKNALVGMTLTVTK